MKSDVKCLPSFSSIIETEEDVQIETFVNNLVEDLMIPTKAIILYNDDHNTFPHVIDCLTKYCGQDKIQAEQCALIVHHKGKCDVKHGSFKELKPICEALLEKGLSAKIEE